MSRSGQYKWSAVGRSTPMSFSIVALRNHGKCSNGKNNSSLSNSTQKPCCEMLVISTGKVLIPGIDNLLQMVFDQLLSLRHNVLGEARLTGQFNFRLQPKRGFSIRVRNMIMYPCLLPGEEKEQAQRSRGSLAHPKP